MGTDNSAFALVAQALFFNHPIRYQTAEGAGLRPVQMHLCPHRSETGATTV
jgi:hypothetical protein